MHRRQGKTENKKCSNTHTVYGLIALLTETSKKNAYAQILTNVHEMGHFPKPSHFTCDFFLVFVSIWHKIFWCTKLYNVVGGNMKFAPYHLNGFNCMLHRFVLKMYNVVLYNVHAQFVVKMTIARNYQIECIFAHWGNQMTTSSLYKIRYQV